MENTPNNGPRNDIAPMVPVIRDSRQSNIRCNQHRYKDHDGKANFSHPSAKGEKQRKCEECHSSKRKRGVSAWKRLEAFANCYREKEKKKKTQQKKKNTLQKPLGRN
jgi:hypothetical protein